MLGRGLFKICIIGWICLTIGLFIIIHSCGNSECYLARIRTEIWSHYDSSVSAAATASEPDLVTQLFTPMKHMHRRKSSANKFRWGDAPMIGAARQQHRQQKVILVWGKLWLKFTHFNFSTCAVSNCVTTIDRRQLDQSDAVIFHGRWDYRNDMPTVRPNNQYWIYQNHESQERSFAGASLSYLNGKMNFTMTYLTNSDIYAGYGKLQRRSEVSLDNRIYTHQVRHRKKLVAWLVSNCVTPSKRELYFAELVKHVQADRFGKCSPTDACRGYCLSYLSRHYKFYFAAENSLCEDYITEKLYRNALSYGIVPIVYGGADYSKFLPPHSYIDVKDFHSPRELAAYLKILDMNDFLYNEYLKWREEYKIIFNVGPCNLCAFLNQKTIPHKVQTRLEDFWSREDCISTEKYWKTVMKNIYV